jgi:hypothetical protein
MDLIQFKNNLDILLYKLNNPDDIINEKYLKLKSSIELSYIIMIEKSQIEDIKSKDNLITKIDQYIMNCKNKCLENEAKTKNYIKEIEQLKLDSLLNTKEKNFEKYDSLKKNVELFIFNNTLMEFDQSSGCLIELNSIENNVLKQINLLELFNKFII